jgi:hypothetical protein
MKYTQVLGHMLKVASQAPIPVDPTYAKRVEATNAKQGLAKVPAKPVKSPFAPGPTPGQFNVQQPVTPGGR